jgi:hypothetical protein
MRNIWSRRQVDLERELRARRPRPRAEFVEALAAEVRSRPAGHSRVGRIGLAFAISGLILVVVASFGGISYASSAVSHAVKKTSAVQHAANAAAPSAAQAQYGDYTPPTTTTPSNPPSGGTGGNGGSGGTGGNGGSGGTGGTSGGSGGTSGGQSSSGGTGTGGTSTVAGGVAGTEASSGVGPAVSASAPAGSSSNLPFTGLALWVPLLVGIGLIATGLVLRMRGRGDPNAQL